MISPKHGPAARLFPENYDTVEKKVKTKCVRKQKRSQKTRLCDSEPVVSLRDVNCCKDLWGRFPGIPTRGGQSHCQMSSLSRHANPSIHPVQCLLQCEGEGSSIQDRRGGMGHLLLRHLTSGEPLPVLKPYFLGSGWMSPTDGK